MYREARQVCTGKLTFPPSRTTGTHISGLTNRTSLFAPDSPFVADAVGNKAIRFRASFSPGEAASIIARLSSDASVTIRCCVSLWCTRGRSKAFAREA
jgi:hypothetical protein